MRRLLAARQKGQAIMGPEESRLQRIDHRLGDTVPGREKWMRIGFRAFVDWQIVSGTHGLVPVGTTGESATLSFAEHCQVVSACIAETKGRVPVIAGSGSNNTVEAIALAQHAEKAGADGASRRHALLQQALAGGHVSAFQGNQRGGRHSGPDL